MVVVVIGVAMVVLVVGGVWLEVSIVLLRTHQTPFSLTTHLNDVLAHLIGNGSLELRGEYGCKAENQRNDRRRITRSVARSLTWLNRRKLTSFRHSKDSQIDSSLLILWEVVHCRSLLVE